MFIRVQIAESSVDMLQGLQVTNMSVGKEGQEGGRGFGSLGRRDLARVKFKPRRLFTERDGSFKAGSCYSFLSFLPHTQEFS